MNAIDPSGFGATPRLPPTNVQAEQALLGALLANNRAYERVSEFLQAEHFADPLHGRIYQAISRRIEASQIADAITLKAEFANENLGLWPGEYRDVEVDLGVHANAVSVPTVALQEGQKGSFVYVVGAESRAELRVVTPGLIDGDRTEIVAGLKAGERVVVDGQLRLAAGAAVREATGTPGAAPSRGS